MTVCLYTVCWNEADMIPFFFRHYDPWVDRYVVFDDGSTDGSPELLAANPKVEVRPFRRTNPGSFVLSHTALQNSVWKESRGKDEWAVVTAIDEHLTVRNTPMREYLAAQRKKGVTQIPALGFNVIGDTLPGGDVRLVDVARHAVPAAHFNKLSIFDPSAITDAGFMAGRHRATPVGRLLAPQTQELLLLHFKFIGFRRTFERHNAEGARLGPIDRERGYGRHYLLGEEQFRAHWNGLLAKAIDLSALPGDAPDAARGSLPESRRGRVLRSIGRLKSSIFDRREPR